MKNLEENLILVILRQEVKGKLEELGGKVIKEIKLSIIIWVRCFIDIGVLL